MTFHAQQSAKQRSADKRNRTSWGWSLLAVVIFVQQCSTVSTESQPTHAQIGRYESWDAMTPWRESSGTPKQSKRRRSVLAREIQRSQAKDTFLWLTRFRAKDTRLSFSANSKLNSSASSASYKEDQGIQGWGHFKWFKAKRRQGQEWFTKCAKGSLVTLVQLWWPDDRIKMNQMCLRWWWL